ncbi:MAG TPA: DUF1631 family protein, partial [Ramlibacter sp.]|nr:DUF1631 family protein [Ramlibacter sp.]
MPNSAPTVSSPQARAAREQFVAHLEAVLPALSDAIRARFIEMADAVGNSREMHDRRDRMLEFERDRGKWVSATQAAWRRAVVPPTATARVRLQMANLELIGDDVVENKILSSRLALAVQEKAVWDLNELKLRIQHLEGGDDLATEDVLRPEALAQLLIEQWTAAGFSRDAWAAAKELIHQHVTEQALEAYRLANEYLIAKGVLRDIDLSARVKQSPEGAVPRRAPEPAGAPSFAVSRPGAPPGGTPTGAGSMAPRGGPATGGGPAGVAGPAGPGVPAGPAAPAARPAGAAAAVADETRLMTSNPPLARARARASGVIGQLKRLLAEAVGSDAQPAAPASPALAEALAHHATQVQTQVQAHAQTRTQDGGEVVLFDDSAVQHVAQDLRSRTSELKKKASTNSEKAIIEIVALMFQSILAEERIPPAVRVWFARLQMPVLRVAISEPEFFGSLEHPARQLIDRMGSCVLGFDAAAISGSALETEIKRVVQVIEQYPETGRRVFQLVYDEFQKFLSRFLTQKGPTQKLVSVAQQVEQKETMAIQYTIELRKMLSDVPVREEIREFLFKVWAEVLAVAAVKHGPQDEETLALKKSASDLVWAASAKPNRNDRAQVIQDLPDLLARLRRGMGMLGLEPAEQENHIKVIGDTLADAFLSKTEAIPHARIEEMTRRLANLEDFVSDDDAGDLPLDQESIEMMLGIDASMIEVISQGGTQPSAAIMSWANELQLGTWFTLDHNGRVAQVQYAWASDRRQLHLFAASDGYCYLMPLRRLGAYLQAGLIVPT